MKKSTGGVRLDYSSPETERAIPDAERERLRNVRDYEEATFGRRLPRWLVWALAAAIPTLLLLYVWMIPRRSPVRWLVLAALLVCAVYRPVVDAIRGRGGWKSSLDREAARRKALAELEAGERRDPTQ